MEISKIAPAPRSAAGAPSREAMEAARGFEEMLVRELASQLVASSGLDEGDAGTQSSAALAAVPGALAEAVTEAGGLGIAPLLAGELDRSGS